VPAAVDVGEDLPVGHVEVEHFAQTEGLRGDLYICWAVRLVLTDLVFDGYGDAVADLYHVTASVDAERVAPDRYGVVLPGAGSGGGADAGSVDAFVCEVTASGVDVVGEDAFDVDECGLAGTVRVVFQCG
jgi:hypothetical protein